LQDEGDEAYLQTYISDDEDDADNDSNEYLWVVAVWTDETPGQCSSLT
jgi:hypothetical protein